MNINIVNVRAQLADIINRAAYQGERVILERRGKGVAALVSLEDLALIEKLEDESDAKAVKAARAEMQRTGEKPIAWETVKAKLAAKRLKAGGAAGRTRGGKGGTGGLAN